MSDNGMTQSTANDAGPPDGLDDDYLRELCAVDGDWGGTPWGEAINALLDRLADAEGNARWFRKQADHHIGRANRAEQALGAARAELLTSRSEELVATGALADCGETLVEHVCEDPLVHQSAQSTRVTPPGESTATRPNGEADHG